MRRRTLIRALSGAGLGVATALVAGCARRTRRSEPGAEPKGRAVRIAVLGDSLALGTGASNPRNGFVFRSYLAVRERRPGSEIDSYAIGGSTVADVLRLQVPRLAHERADAVVICVGGNDVTHRVAPARFAATYAALLARVRALQPHAAIVCCGVPNVGFSPLFTGTDHDEVARLARADDAAVRASAHRAGARFADLYAATSAKRADINAYLSDDRFHPSDAGYAALAAVLTPVLLETLARRAT
jgi:lysophospholipase L1-like esterase